MKSLPKKGFVFWPVGNGDSTTVVIKSNESVIQIDLRHCTEAEDEDSPMIPVVDKLVGLLPKRDGRPYLSLFVLTHPDKDHILGFQEPLDKVIIGEIWHTPRIFTEYKADLCDDAKAFRKETERRRDVTIKNEGDVKSGDRVRIIGHDDIFLEDEYRDFPHQWRSSPGRSITMVDGMDRSAEFEAFVHAPFQDEGDDTRNNTSLALHIALAEGEQSGKGLFFGDRDYPKIKRIFDKTKEENRQEYLEWNVVLSAHHCSKSVMYWKDEGEDSETSREDIMDDFAATEMEGAFVIASSHSDFSDKDGKNPPHLKARRRYEEIVETGHFLCTHEHPNKKQPEPIVFVVDGQGFRHLRTDGRTDEAAKSVAQAVAAARGGSAPPKEQIGFGRVA